MSEWTATEQRILGIFPRVAPHARFGLEVVTPAASEPVTLDELKAFLRVDGTAENGLITSLGIAARVMVESHTARALMQQQLALHLDQAPYRDSIELPRAPLKSVESIVSIALGSTTPVTFALSNVTIDTSKTPGIIRLVNGATWPRTLREQDSLIINYTAGESSAANVPAPLKEAIKLLVAAWFEQRGQMESVSTDIGDLFKIPASALVMMRLFRVRTL